MKLVLQCCITNHVKGLVRIFKCFIQADITVFRFYYTSFEQTVFKPIGKLINEACPLPTLQRKHFHG